MSAMLSKSFLLLALLFATVSLSAAYRPLLRLQLRHGRKISKLSGDPLVKTACRNVGNYESDCISTLQSAPQHQRANANELAFFTLRFVENHAVNLTTDIKKVAKIPDISPLLQSALSDCTDQYNPLDDLIEDAINAVLANAYSDAKKFIEAAICDIDECDSELKSSNLEEKSENGTGEDVELAKNLKESNLFLKNMLSAALNILKAN